MALSDLLSVTILVQGRSPSQLGFGTPLLAAYHAKYVDRVREYATIEEIEADGWVAADAVHKAATAVFSASPRVQTLKVGRRALAPAQRFKVIPTTTTEGDVITLSVDGVDVSYEVPGAASVASIVAALKTAIDDIELTGVVTVDHTTYLEVKNGTAATPAIVRSGNGPFNLRGLGATQIKAQFNAGGEQDFTLSATAAIVTGGTAAWPLTATLVLKVNGGASQSITITTAADGADAAGQINNQILGAHASVTMGGDLKVTSDRLGTGASVQFTTVTNSVGTSGFVVGTTSGGGDAADFEAVTAAEVVAKLSTLTNGAAAVDGLKVKLTSTTLGASGSATVKTGGTANAVFGGDFASNVVNTGSDTSAGTVGGLHELAGLDGLSLEDITADPGIAADLAAIYLADSDWYGLFLDSNGGLEVAAAATWAETHTVIFGAASADTGCIDGGVTTDPMSVQKTAAHARTFVSFHEFPFEFMQGEWLSRVLATKPGSATWANKALPGITPSILTTTQQAAIRTKNGNWYSTIKAIGFTLNGKSASGEWIDTTVGVDWLTDQLNTGAVALLSGADKIPFTDAGADLWRAMISGCLERGIKGGFLASSPKPTVTIPLVADVSPTDKTARNLPDVEFSATLAGAIHKATIVGRLSA